MGQNDRTVMGYCLADAPEHECFSSVQHRFLCAVYDVSCEHTFQPGYSMVQHDIKSQETLHSVWHIFWTIVPVVYFFGAARFFGQLLPQPAHSVSVLRFVVEFAIIALPTVVSVNVANGGIVYFAILTSVLLLVLIYWQRCWEKVKHMHFELGRRRPSILTLDRATINILTIVCILAVDFESFPSGFRKTRRFGAGLMDTGIGLFVFSMGTVSRPWRKLSDLKHMLRVVLPLLFLGFARTVVIMAIDYHQDEHEYGVHLNAFFTLGLTKLFGMFISGIARRNHMLLPLGLVVLALHEMTLQISVSDYVMNKKVKRDTFFAANREGICSLPGFVALYIISIQIGQWLQTSKAVGFDEFKRRFITLLVACVITWMLTVVSIFTIGIARVTCNFGYVIWMLAIANGVMVFFNIIFHLILDTLWPVNTTDKSRIGGGEGEMLLKSTMSECCHTALPMLVEAINYNGLVFFLLGNILTGGVNIFLHPDERTDFESVVILSIYLLIAMGFIYILYRYKIRIA